MKRPNFHQVSVMNWKKEFVSTWSLRQGLSFVWLIVKTLARTNIYLFFSAIGGKTSLIKYANVRVFCLSCAMIHGSWAFITLSGEQWKLFDFFSQPVVEYLCTTLRMKTNLVNKAMTMRSIEWRWPTWILLNLLSSAHTCLTLVRKLSLKFTFKMLASNAVWSIKNNFMIHELRSWVEISSTIRQSPTVKCIVLEIYLKMKLTKWSKEK